MREFWLSENQRLVSQDNFGNDLPSVEAATKKHEAIETDIYAYEERVQAVIAVAAELEAENYHDVERINERLALFWFFALCFSNIHSFLAKKTFSDCGTICSSCCLLVACVWSSQWPFRRSSKRWFTSMIGWMS